jgi:glycosyltransferase involved in cell wall biosynthesis
MGSDVARFEERDRPETIGDWLTVRLLRDADYITPPSNFLVEVINRLGDFREKTERIIWGIQLDKFVRTDASDLRRRLGLDPTARVIVSPKTLQPLYRIHLLVEAMAIVRGSHSHAVLVLSEYVPDEEYRDEIVRRIDELDLGRQAVFSGPIEESEMPAFYSMADVSIAIPPRDGMPLALFESLACGTPQILSRLPRYEEIVQHEESAYFVDPDPESIAAGIVRLLEDDKLRSRIVQQGRRVVEGQADLDEQAARVDRRIRELADRIRPQGVRISVLLSSAVAVPAAYLRLRRRR